MTPNKGFIENMSRVHTSHICAAPVHLPKGHLQLLAIPEK